MKHFVLSFVGRSGCGKTTLLENLIGVLTLRGYRVAVIKHSGHANVETDLPGKDTRRLWDAGAQHTVFATQDRLVHTQRCSTPPTLKQALGHIPDDVDFILVEGYKRSDQPKVQVVRAACDPAPLHGLSNVVACVTDVPGIADGYPGFDFADIPALADFIVDLASQPYVSYSLPTTRPGEGE